MALVLADRVKETSTTTGTVTYSFAGAVSGFESFGSIGDGNTTYYACTLDANFEVGIGTYTASGTTLARTTILQSSNSDNAVDWGAGTKTLFCTQPAEKAVFRDESGNVSFTGDLTITSTDAGATEDPTLELYRNSANPDVADVVGHIDFTGMNDASTPEKVVYAKINSDIADETDGTEDGRLDISVISNGSNSARMTFQGNGHTLVAGRDLRLQSGIDLVYEGDAQNGTRTTVTVAGPSSARTITFPDASGTVALNESGILNLTNSGAQSELRLYCESSNAHYASLKAPAHADFGGNVTSTLPSVTGTLIGTANADAPATTTSSGDADHVLINDGGVLKKITKSNLGIGSGSASNSFETIAVSGQSNVVADSSTDTLTLVAGSNMTITTDASGDSVTFASSGSGGSASDSFKTLSVSGQSDVVADSSTDTLTLVAGSNMTITTDASADSITFASSGSGGGATNLNGLSDVAISSVQNNDLIKYNSTAGEWQNTNLGLTVTPTLSFPGATYYNDDTSISITVSNHSSYDNPAYSVEVRRADNNNLIYDMDSASGSQETILIYTDSGRTTGNILVYTSHSSSNFDTPTTDNFKILVTAQDFGDLQSETATLNVTVTQRPQISLNSSTAYRYWRLYDMDNRVFFIDWRAYSGINQTGTEYPGTLTSSSTYYTSDRYSNSWTSDGYTNVASCNHNYSSSYAPGRVFDGTTSAFSGYWSLQGNNSSYFNETLSSYNYEYISFVWDMGTARTIKSMSLKFNDQYTLTVGSSDNAFVMQGSNDNNNWTTVATVTDSDQDFSSTSGTTTVLMSDTS